MQLLKGLSADARLSVGCVAAIGNFDGVHQGHQALISLVVEQSKRLSLPSLVFLFEPQPAEYFNPQNPPARLTSLRDKVGRLKKLGVDFVSVLSFNHSLANMLPDMFLSHLSSPHYNIHSLFVGEDFRFGKGRLGDVELLKAHFKKFKRSVHIFPDYLHDGQRVSSTLIRQALAESNLKKARELLGRDFSLCRRVIKGEGRGRQWGIPTANFAMSQATLPLNGVFSVLAIRHGVEILNGVANIGCRPTVDGLKNNLEVHLLNFDQSIYGELIEIIFLDKIRDEVKFSSIDMLIDQIKNDIKIAKNYFQKRLFIDGNNDVKAVLTNCI